MTDRVLSKRERHRAPASAMTESYGTFFRLAIAPRFARVHFDDAGAERIRDAAERGTVVYAMRHMSTLDFLFFNWLYARIGLPLARFANRIHPVLWMPLGRLLARLLRRRGVGPVTRAGGLVSAGYSLLLFLKNPPGTPQGIDSLDYLTELIRRQRELVRPILVVPQMLLEKEPHRLRGSHLDRILGHRRLSRWRQLLRFWWRPNQARAVIGEIVDLQAEIATSGDRTDEEIARRVRRRVLGSLAAERRVVVGPAVKPQRRMKESILHNRHFRTELGRIAEQEGRPVPALLKRARHLLDEIAADFKVSMIRFMSGFLRRFVWPRMYGGEEGFVLDDGQVQRLKELARSTSLILMPCHKSHLDYLLISYLLFHRDMIPPHIAAGVNMNIRVIGPMFRRAGAFFLRRTFRGDPLYAAVFRNYIKQLFREGFSIEFFVEGTRSRTGKLLRPKLGILSMLLEAYGELQGREVAIVPISLSYEDVVEDTAYTDELLGGTKQKEDFTGLAKSSTGVLAKEYGKVFIRFAEPIRLSEYWREKQQADQDPLDRRNVEGLAYRVLHAIDRETALTPSALVAASLLTSGRSAMSQTEIVADMEYLARALKRSGMPQAPRLSNPVGAFLDVRNRFLGKGLVGLQPHGAEALVTVEERKRVQLDYYKNNAMPWLVPRAMVALAVLQGPTPLDRERLVARVRRLSQLLREEFIFPPRDLFMDHLNRSAAAFLDEGLLVESPEGLTVTDAGGDRLRFNARLLANFLAGYHATCLLVPGLPAEPLRDKDLVKRLMAAGRRQYLAGQLSRAEVLTRNLYQNVVRVLQHAGVLAEYRPDPPPSKHARLVQRTAESAERAAALAAEIGEYLAALEPETDRDPAEETAG